MPYYTYNEISLAKADKSYTRFDLVHSPTNPAPFSGIYHCTVCKYEIACPAGRALPPTTDAGHKQWGCYDDSGTMVKWQLIVETLARKPAPL